MKVVITDNGYEHVNQERAILEGFGAQLITASCKTEDEVIACAFDADAIICQFAPITAKVINALKKCRVIVRYAVGVDTIDAKSAQEKGIYVCNVPDYGSEEVATHAMALMLAAVRKLICMRQAVLAGTWSYTAAKPIRRLYGQTLGLVGFGRIPRLIAEKAKGFGLRIVVSDPFVDPESIVAAGCVPVAFEELLETSHIISVHAPLTEGTRHMFDRRVFSLMKNQPYIINTSRGGVMDEKALLEALESGKISGAALDVCEKEPADPANPLLRRDDVLITPHSAWYSEESIQALQRSVAEEVVRVLRGQKPKNPVNVVGKAR